MLKQGTGLDQPSGTQTVHPAAPPPLPLPLRILRAFLQWLRHDLFRRTAHGPVGWRKVALAVVCLVAAVAVSLSRTVGPGSLNTIWIEDARNLLNEALNLPSGRAIRTPISSYYQVPARLITATALLFPLRAFAAIIATAAAAQYAMYGLVAYIASGPHLRSPWLRLLIAAPVCALPLAYTQVNNDLVTVQFCGLFGAFWTVLWLPGTRAGKLAAPFVMWTVSWTAVLAIVLGPLIVARLLVDRSKTAWAIAVAWATGMLLQMSTTILGESHHDEFGFNGLPFVLRNYVTHVVPRALFGERSLGGAGVDYTGRATPLHITSVFGHHALIVGAWLLVIAAVALAATRFTAPNWTLAGVAALFSVGVFTDELLINTPVVQTRYVVAPALLLYTALVALLRPRITGRNARWFPAKAIRNWTPAACLALVLLVAVALNFRVVNGRTATPPWTSAVTAATKACAAPGTTAYTFVHEWWFATIPCGKIG